MTDDNAEILDFLRARFARQDERFDRIDRKLDEVITRLGAVERDVVDLHGDFAALSQRLDNLDRRVGRLELAGAVEPRIRDEHDAWRAINEPPSPMAGAPFDLFIATSDQVIVLLRRMLERPEQR